MKSRSKKTLAQKRSEDEIFYQDRIRAGLLTLTIEGLPEDVIEQIKAKIHRAKKALVICRLDPIAADRVFHGITA
jgi:hypothetical protein